MCDCLRLSALCWRQFVIFLYLMDNDTSFVVLLSSGVGLLIELWKVTKAMDVTFDRRRGFPWVHFADKAGYQYAPRPIFPHNSL